MSDEGKDSRIAIQVDHLSKCFHIYDTPRDRLKQFVLPRLQNAIYRAKKNYFREFWALRNVSFEVNKGETVGIIGRNGSGKSTLLQIVCGTLSPTGGSVATTGRVAALLELGAGFNPEFTGRENVYMNGAVLGLTEAEISARFPEISAFADIGDFIEQPVKTYSSGMVVRLAFAVAINVDPEILVIDEALSVGDELFQRKCFSRIEAIKNNGATIMFVSHSGAAIVDLCDRAVLMDSGEVLAMGPPKLIVGCYQKLLYAPVEKSREIMDQIRSISGRDKFDQNYLDSIDDTKTTEKRESVESGADDFLKEFFDSNLLSRSVISYESRGATISSLQVVTLDGEPVNNLISGKEYCFTYTVDFYSTSTNVRFGMLIKTTAGVELGGSVTADSVRDTIPFIEANRRFMVKFKFSCFLAPGVYFLNAGVLGEIDGAEVFLHRVVDATMFRVMAPANKLMTCIIDFKCVPEFSILDGNE